MAGLNDLSNSKGYCEYKDPKNVSKTNQVNNHPLSMNTFALNTKSEKKYSYDFTTYILNIKNMRLFQGRLFE